MKKITIALAALFVLLCLPIFCHAQTTKDTSLFTDRYEVLKITSKRPLFAQAYPLKDTSWAVYLTEPLRITVRGTKLTAGHLGTFTILSYNKRVYHYGSDGDSVWESWDLKGGNRATLHEHTLMLSIQDGKVMYAYTMQVIHRPGTPL
jgi:hypothetical protein